MSIYATIPGIGDIPNGDDPTIGELVQYRGSHILPADDDPRGGSIGLALIPSHITRDGRDDTPSDLAPWPWLRLDLDVPGDDPTVLLNPQQARHLAAQLTDWADSTGDPMTDQPEPRVCAPCPACDHTLTPDGTCPHGCTTSPACGEECAEGHAYAGRCTLYDPAACTWPDCLTDGQQAELAAQVRQSMLGEPTVPMPDQRQMCGCRDTTARTVSDNPATSNDGLRMERLAAERDMLGRDADRLRRDWAAMRERAETAEAKLAAVRDLHRPRGVVAAAEYGERADCAVCGDNTYPCPTTRALDGPADTSTPAEPVHAEIRDGHSDPDNPKEASHGV